MLEILGQFVSISFVMIVIISGFIGEARNLNEEKGNIKFHVLDNTIDIRTRQANIIFSQSTIFLIFH